MGIIDKGALNPAPQQLDLTADELKFVLTKLRTATYTGNEFETFYLVWVKLSKALEKLEK